MTPTDTLARVEADLRAELGTGWEQSPADEMVDEVLHRLSCERGLADALAARPVCAHSDAAHGAYWLGIVLGAGVVAASQVSPLAGSLFVGSALVGGFFFLRRAS